MPQAALLSATFGIPAGSTGAMLREEKARGTEIGKEAELWTVEGKLFPDELALRVVWNWLDNRRRFILDGFPRTLGQARSFDQDLEVRELPLDAVYLLMLSETLGRERMTTRLTCSRCSSVFNERFHNVSNTTPCPKCGGELVRRNDDTEEALDRRLAQFRECTVPVAHHYQRKGLAERGRCHSWPRCRVQPALQRHSRGDIGMIPIKRGPEIDHMRRAGEMAAEILNRLADLVAPGVSTGEIDRAAAQFMREAGVQSAFLGYKKFPGHICISINEEVVHGIGGARRIRYGDVVKMDVGIIREGWIGDTAMSVPVGIIEPETERLLTVTEQILDGAVQLVQAGHRLGDVSAYVEEQAIRNGYSVVREFVGHGVGRHLHEEPQIPNFGNAAPVHPEAGHDSCH